MLLISIGLIILQIWCTRNRPSYLLELRFSSIMLKQNMNYTSRASAAIAIHLLLLKALLIQPSEKDRVYRADSDDLHLFKINVTIIYHSFDESYEIWFIFNGRGIKIPLAFSCYLEEICRKKKLNKRWCVDWLYFWVSWQKSIDRLPYCFMANETINDS